MKTADPFGQLGIRRRINAAGALTRLGGAIMAPEVVAAMAAASRASVDIGELQDAASARIAEATGAEAVLVTTGGRGRIDARSRGVDRALGCGQDGGAAARRLPARHPDPADASHRLCPCAGGIRRAPDRHRPQRPRHRRRRARAGGLGDRGGDVAVRRRHGLLGQLL
jgi:hypothetical protein